MKTEEQRLKYNAYMKKWSRKKRGTKLGALPGRPKNTDGSLWEMVDKKEPNECWKWKGYVNNGYGRVQIDGRAYYAHRVIFDLANPGVITRSSPRYKKDYGFLMHSCDNRLCCNPFHLKVATILQNNQDCNQKKRRNLPKGEDHFRSVFTNDQIKKILEMRQSGKTTTQISVAMNKNRSTVKSLLRRRIINA